MTHPATESLVPIALGAGDAAAKRHVERCAVCRAEVARLRESAAVLQEVASLEHRRATPECLDDEAIADFIDGRLPASDRQRIVEHLASCARCRSAVHGTSSIVAHEASITGWPERRWNHWFIPVGFAAAAAAVLLLVRLPQEGEPSRDELRGRATDSVVIPEPIEPRATVDRVDRLIWSNVPGSLRYRVRVYDERSSVLWSGTTEDTTAVLPDSVRLAPQVTYLWKVEANMDWQRWVSSDLVEFRVRVQP